MDSAKKALVIGNHPIRQNIIDQAQAKGHPVNVFNSFADIPDDYDYCDLFVLPEQGISDEDTLQSLETLAQRFPETGPAAPKPICHLLLHDQISLWLLQTLDFYVEIQRKFELYPFTVEDQWAKNVICQPNPSLGHYPHLDHESINRESNKTVHLLIHGLSGLGESIAIHTALTAHFPNYERDHSLRTRITIVDEKMRERRNAFIQRYKNLFDHSYYRTIDVANGQMVQYHEPVYTSMREDFVDIEWEFIEGGFFHPIVQQKLAYWAEDPEQMLTIALCNCECSSNFNEAFALPTEVYQKNIPVLVYVKHSRLLDKVKDSGMYGNLYPFGMEECGYDIKMPLLQMAKRLNYCYAYCFEHKTIPTQLNDDEVEQEWRKLESFSFRYSNIYNVMTLATKMRILDHHDDDWEKFYALTQEEIEQLSAVEHNRWSVDRLILGFRPPTDIEREEIEKNIQQFILAKKTGGEKPDKDLKTVYKRKKVHYDLSSYRELREDKTGENVKALDYDLTACIPLIAQSYNELR